MNLNAWLHQNGYLVLKDGKSESGDWFEDVDWSRTRAYTMGLNGLYMNIKGREREGIVEAGAQAEALKEELRWQARWTGRSRIGQSRHHGHVRLRRRLRRPLCRQCSRPDRRLRRRLPRLVGFGHGKSDHARFSKTISKPGAVTTALTHDWFPACCSPTAKSPSKSPPSWTWPHDSETLRLGIAGLLRRQTMGGCS